jgi:3-oxoadipate enol-lactonase
MAPNLLLVEAEGTSHAVSDEGEGPPVVLIHAGVADRRMWEDVVAQLGPGFRVVRPDLRGYGDTDPGDGTFTHERDLLAILDALRVERATLVGASAGGAVALALATLAPERFGAVVLLAPNLPDHEPSERLAAFAAAEDAVIEARDLDRAVALNVDLWAAQLDAAGKELVAAMQRRAFELQIDATAEEDELDPPLAERLTNLALPVEILVGDRDLPDFRAIAERLGRELPQARVTIVPGGGHLLALQDPAVVAAAIRSAATPG